MPLHGCPASVGFAGAAILEPDPLRRCSLVFGRSSYLILAESLQKEVVSCEESPIIYVSYVVARRASVRVFFGQHTCMADRMTVGM